VRILGSTQDKIVRVIIQQIKKTRVSPGDAHHKIDDLVKHLIQIQAATDGLTDLVKDLEFLAGKVEGLLYVVEGIRCRHRA
jgi:hypothetical protein